MHINFCSSSLLGCSLVGCAFAHNGMYAICSGLYGTKHNKLQQQRYNMDNSDIYTSHITRDAPVAWST